MANPNDLGMKKGVFAAVMAIIFIAMIGLIVFFVSVLFPGEEPYDDEDGEIVLIDSENLPEPVVRFVPDPDFPNISNLRGIELSDGPNENFVQIIELVVEQDIIRRANVNITFINMASRTAPQVELGIIELDEDGEEIAASSQMLNISIASEEQQTWSGDIFHHEDTARLVFYVRDDFLPRPTEEPEELDDDESYVENGLDVDTQGFVYIFEYIDPFAHGGTYTLALTADGALYGWGDNWAGQLGDGTTENRDEAVWIMDDVAAFSTNTSHTLAITSDGSLWAWGMNNNGQIGNGMRGQDQHEPLRIMNDVAYISAGFLFSMAITTDGALFGWGGNFDGNLGIGTLESPNVPTMVMEGVVSVSADTRMTSAVDIYGNTWAWGNIANWPQEWLENVDEDAIENFYDDMYGDVEVVLAPTIVMQP